MLIFPRLWHIIIVAKEIGEIPLDKTKTLRVAALRVFLFVNGEPIRSGCYCLFISIQPFAYVIANYTCYDRNKKTGEYFFH